MYATFDRDGAVELAYEVGDGQPVRWHRRVAIESGVEPDVPVKLFLRLERSVRNAVYAYKLGPSTPLAHLGVVVRLAKHRQSGVRVQVDESGTDDPPGSVDRAGQLRDWTRLHGGERRCRPEHRQPHGSPDWPVSVDYKSVGY